MCGVARYPTSALAPGDPAVMLPAHPIEAVSATAALRDLPEAAGVLLGWWGWTHVAEHATAAQQIGWPENFAGKCLGGDAQGA